MNVLIVDDHKLFNTGFKSILSQIDIFINIFQLYDSLEVMSFLQQNENIEFIFLDMNMPNKNGIDVAREVLAVYPHMNILTVTMHLDLTQIRQLKNIGVKGYILKINDINEVLEAVTAIKAGNLHFPKEESNTQENSKNKLLSKLTSRELEVLNLIKNGKSTTDIAHELFVSTHTIITHRKNLHLKLDINNERDLVRFALEMGL
jgi:DNA-binding NarL/FixJ family response regulator